MTLFHVNASVITKGKSRGGAAGFAHYLARDAAWIQQYLAPGGHERADLVAQGAGALPGWAKDGAHFFAMADRYERHGGVIARHYQISLPRELGPQERLDLAADIRSAFFARYPHVWTVHCPHARDGSGEQPHLDVMFSTRREDQASLRTPKQWFARAANQGQDPLAGGVRKDRVWDQKQTLQGVRAEVAMLINAALEREGIPMAVSHASLAAQGHDREAAVYTTVQDRERVEAHRVLIHREYQPWETEVNRATWHAQKAQEGIDDISREAILDHVRDHFWRHDHSPARAQERAQSISRALDREWARTEDRCWHPDAPTLARAQTRQRMPSARLMVEGQADRMREGVHVDLNTHEREAAHG